MCFIRRGAREHVRGSHLRSRGAVLPAARAPPGARLWVWPHHIHRAHLWGGWVAHHARGLSGLQTGHRGWCAVSDPIMRQFFKDAVSWRRVRNYLCFRSRWLIISLAWPVQYWPPAWRLRNICKNCINIFWKIIRTTTFCLNKIGCIFNQIFL